jgi:hypothetical protein
MHVRILALLLDAARQAQGGQSGRLETVGDEPLTHPAG